MDQNDNQPRYRAYAVIKRRDQKDYWQSIGAGFVHRDNLGLSVSLQVLPLDGRVVLRPFKEKQSVDAPE